MLCEPRTSHLPPPLGMRRRSSTSVSMDLSLAPVTSEDALAPGASPDSKPQEAQLPFLRCSLLLQHAMNPPPPGTFGRPQNMNGALSAQTCTFHSNPDA